MNNTIYLPFILVVIINVLWYTIKSILLEKGYRVDYWYGHFKDIPNLKNLINKAENPIEKATYTKMFLGLIITIVIFIATVSIMFINFLNT